LSQKASAIVVLTFPRSGTHVLIDFIRRNIGGYHCRLPLWASSEGLYYDLDHIRPELSAWSTKALERPHLIIKTHALPFDDLVRSHLHEITRDREVYFLSPLRSGSSMLASYARFSRFAGSLPEFLRSIDSFTQTGATVQENFQTFLDFAAARSQFIDVTQLAKEPDMYAAAIAAYVNAPLLAPKSRVPPRRRFSGRIGELHARLTGRASSEVVAPSWVARPSWPEDEIPREIAERIEAARLRDVRHSHGKQCLERWGTSDASEPQSLESQLSG
jgi:hypothetical protein